MMPRDSGYFFWATLYMVAQKSKPLPNDQKKSY